MKIRKIVIAIFCAAIIAPAFFACKKGQNDPFLSLKSRTARLTGDWVVSASTYTYMSGTTTTTWTYTDPTIIATAGGTTQTGTYSWTYTINKDGTWTSDYSHTFSGTTYSSKTEGTWFWSNANKDQDIKNKEMLLLRINRETIMTGGTTDIYTYSGENLRGYMVDQLKSKEIVLKYKNVYTGTTTQTTEEEITLTQ